MRHDKASNLRERLRRGVSNFDFDALIKGVSNIDGPEPADGPAEVTSVSPTRAAAAAPSGVIEGDAPPIAQAPADAEGLRAAVMTLGDRLLQEAGKLAHALNSHDAAEGGYYLFRVNQVLDLLNAVDPRGDLARSLKTPVAPPAGHTWPRAAWSFYEFAESPISGLLPGDADDAFCAAVVAEATCSAEM